MSDSIILPKSPLNIQSTQEALTMLRNLRQKRKKQNPASIYELVKSIHNHLKDSGTKKGITVETISSQDYLGANRESIEQMLVYIKNKIIEGGHGFNNSQKQLIKQTKAESEKLQASLLKKQAQIQKLTDAIKASDQQSKSIQIKLLNNVKRLNLQLQQKDVQLTQLKKIVSEKQAQADQLLLLNQKQHKKIRKLEEDLYDLQMQLEQKNEELQAQKQCADFLQKKVGRLINRESLIIHEQDEHNQTISQSQYQQVFPEKSNNIMQQKSTMGTQTELNSPFSSQANSEQNNQCQNQGDNQDQLSQNSILTQSKQSKYIQSIQRLTLQLGEAYHRINQLMKNSQNIQDFQQKDKRKSIDMITTEHVNLQVQLDTKGKNIANKYQNKGKNKTKSGYFSKLWK